MICENQWLTYICDLYRRIRHKKNKSTALLYHHAQTRSPRNAMGTDDETFIPLIQELFEIMSKIASVSSYLVQLIVFF